MEIGPLTIQCYDDAGRPVAAWPLTAANPPSTGRGNGPAESGTFHTLRDYARVAAGSGASVPPTTTVTMPGGSVAEGDHDDAPVARGAAEGVRASLTLTLGCGALAAGWLLAVAA
jgi:hypothetical protein